MDRGCALSYGVHPHHHEWDFVWQEALFIPDFSCHLPIEIGGYCWSSVNDTIVDIFGPTEPSQHEPGQSLLVTNGNSDSDYGQMVRLNDHTQDGTGNGNSGKSGIRRNQHTTALGFTSNSVTAFNRAIYGLNRPADTRHYILRYNSSSNQFVYKTQLINQTFSAPWPSGEAMDFHTVVVTTDADQGWTKIYADGELVLNHSSGQRLYSLSYITLGGQTDGKKKDCFNGHLGPFLVTHGAWTEAQAVEFHANPYGYMRPNYDPIWRVIPPFTPMQGQADVVLGSEALATLVKSAAVQAAVEIDAEALASTTVLQNLQAVADVVFGGDGDLRKLLNAAASGDVVLGAVGELIYFYLPAQRFACQLAGRDLPAETEGRDLPAEMEGREMPEVDSQDRGTDVEDHPSPRKTDVDGQSC